MALMLLLLMMMMMLNGAVGLARRQLIDVTSLTAVGSTRHLNLSSYRLHAVRTCCDEYTVCS